METAVETGRSTETEMDILPQDLRFYLHPSKSRYCVGWVSTQWSHREYCRSFFRNKKKVKKQLHKMEIQGPNSNFLLFSFRFIFFYIKIIIIKN